MSNDYTLPPKTEGQPKMMTIAGDRMELEEGDYIDFGHWLSPDWCEAYGHACAEHVRAPLVEENARLLARVAEMERLAGIGAELVGMTTTLDGLDEIELIPQIWKSAVDERDALVIVREGLLERVAELDDSESKLIAERDHAEEIIDKLCDAVLGSDREEWSSAYFFSHAVEDVEDEIAGLRADLAAKAGEVEALRGFAQKVMEAWPECGVDGFDLEDYAKEFGLIQSTRVEGPCGEDCVCLAAGADWPTDCYHRTALLTGSGPWVNPLAAEVSALRRLLFQLYTVPGMGYTDDGELQESTVHPSIDFLRMTPDQIQEAIRRREGKGGRLGELAAELEKLRADKARIDEVQNQSLRIEPFEMRTPGGDDADVGWRIYTHHQQAPRLREVACHYSDDVRAAIDTAIAARKGEGVAGA